MGEYPRIGAHSAEYLSYSYVPVVSWKKNIMPIPNSKAGKDFIAEVVRLLRLFNLNTLWSSVAINLVMVFFPIDVAETGSAVKGKRESSGRM